MEYIEIDINLSNYDYMYALFDTLDQTPKKFEFMLDHFNGWRKCEWDAKKQDLIDNFTTLEKYEKDLDDLWEIYKKYSSQG